MKQLTTGKAGALKTSSSKAVRAVMHKRSQEGVAERPDSAASNPAQRGSEKTQRVKVSIHAPKAAAFLQRKRTLITG
ncbi:hypothetical protein [Roseateles terrae]|uniref:Uncharacterized protein n=1 Tax=Roseateles terrae TaxID=431060 RepID=A0ABR6GVM2_9BURK|nr:hypothetical protein [Roseateles terrae]MBB3196166.1 hypothetical protein [Roseateles terrae]OWQ85374.1 hypothetical protein CDN98_15690 [Roseateles terrae]